MPYINAIPHLVLIPITCGKVLTKKIWRIVLSRGVLLQENEKHIAIMVICFHRKILTYISGKINIRHTNTDRVILVVAYKTRKETDAMLKLLSPRRLNEFTAEEFHSYIKSLNKPKEYVSTKKDQRELKVRVKRKKDGTLSIVTKRSPPYVTEKEFDLIAIESGVPKNELYSTLRERGFKIHLDHRTASRDAPTGEPISVGK
jgi:hypothetical protein